MSFCRKPVNYNLHHSYAGIALYLDLDERDRILDIGYDLNERDSYVENMEQFCKNALGKKFAELKVTEDDEPGEHRFIGPLALLFFRLKNEWYDGPVPWNQQKGIGLEGLVCRCFGIYLEEIKIFLQEQPMATIAEMTDQMKIGGGCTSCLFDLEKIIHDFRNNTGLVTSEKRRRYRGKTPIECLLRAGELIAEAIKEGDILELRGTCLILDGSRLDHSMEDINKLSQNLKGELDLELIFKDEDSPYCI
jgi:bacterioferritin-associated ferredoxin